MNKDPHFYQAGGKWEPVRCSTSVQGVIAASNQKCNPNVTSTKMHKDCKFYPLKSKYSSASVMYYQTLKLSMFCDKEGPDVAKELQHNKLAPSRQNKKCAHRSAWEVMREHEDFKDSQSQPSSTNTVPEFEFIQESASYRVFVFDVSWSMDGSRITYLNQTAEYIIQNIVPKDSWLGIVTFGDDANITKPMIQVVKQADREELKDAVPKKVANQHTCIPCGITKAIKILKESMGNPESGEIILLSDGKNNLGDIPTVLQKAIKEKVVIHTIAMDNQSDMKLSEIARKTGGKHLTYLNIGRISLTTAFTELLISGSSPTSSQGSVMLLSERINSVTSQEINLQFPIERGLGRNTSVVVMSQSAIIHKLQVNGPNGFQTEVVADRNTADVTMPGIAQVGDYEITITTDGSNQAIECIVMTTPVVSDNDIIRVSAKTSSIFDLTSGKLPIIYADVTKGYMPVINATVKAFIDADGSSCETFLTDNGIDPDSFIEDGVYTGYITPECLRSGRVNIKVYAGGRSGETKIGSSLTASSIANSAAEHEKIYYESFQRVKILEEIHVSHINPAKKDAISPGRITDVNIHHIVKEDTLQGERRNVTITWTATGDDKNLGRASEYMLRISTDFDTLLNKYDNADILAMNVSLIPKEAGEVEALKIVIEAEQRYSNTAYFAVRAIDAAGNVGEVSNIVSIVVAKEFRAYGENGTVISQDNDDKDRAETTSRSSAYNPDAMLIALCILIIHYKKDVISLV
ncbi:calcium-activated chloride channel regulator 4A-like [Mercenaria mercenaria]|uniref:calcium-activated chloride channel regulator 4A-like n=1 Tax=Mercenaria mercenaria TaxID=6596 RepID=UPI00234EE3EF|nr:calcium-activated chloride channel regulator 4A-like [Mercenaria mercenaria]